MKLKTIKTNFKKEIDAIVAETVRQCNEAFLDHKNNGIYMNGRYVPPPPSIVNSETVFASLEKKK